MTSTYLTSSVNYYGGSACYGRSENNFQNFTNYGLNYYNDSGAEYSDQSSISPIASPELSSCRLKNNFQQNSDFPYNYQNYPNYQIKNEENFNKNFNEFQNLKSPQKLSKPQLSAGIKKIIQTHPSNKPIIVAPEVMKRRRVAANARERRRMNSLNFAFDK